MARARKAGISTHTSKADKAIAQAEDFATELHAALGDGTIAPDDAEAMLADLAASGGAAAALAAYVEGVIGRKRATRAPARKKRKRG
ncbi:MAG TPA: hypothetical protein VGM17_12290 [Rhizomicrobium sp.]